MANLFLMQPHIVWLAIKKVKEKREEGVTGKKKREREREREDKQIGNNVYTYTYNTKIWVHIYKFVFNLTYIMLLPHHEDAIV
jgi:hypothetical protein